MVIRPGLPIPRVYRATTARTAAAEAADRVELSSTAPSLKGLLLAGLTPATGIPLAGTPVSLDFATLHWPEAARREVRGHLESLSLTGQATPTELAQAELARAQQLEPRVTPADVATAIERAARATELKPNRHQALFGFSRLIDAKFHLSPALIDKLADRCDQTTLTRLIDGGPDDGAPVWAHPRSPEELVASLVRHLVVGQGSSLQLGLDHSLAEWLEQHFDDSSPLTQAVGGAGAFCANLSAALPEVDGCFFAPGKLSSRLAQRFSPELQAVDESGRASRPDGQVDPGLKERVNYVAEYRKGERFELFGKQQLAINGQVRELQVSGTSRVILGTPTNLNPDFGQTSDSVARQLAATNDVFFVSGAHYLTKRPEAEAEEFAARLLAMKDENPELVRHNQYVVPKDPATEAQLYRHLHGAFDSMSLNAVEMAGVLGRLADDGQTRWNGDRFPDPATAESLKFQLDLALELKSALDVQRLHVHSYSGDLLVLNGRQAPDRQLLALLRARQVAAMKTANDNGEIRSQSDLWPILPMVDARGLAGLYRFADAISERFGLDADQHAAVVKDWHYHDAASQTTFLFSPARALHDKTGGTVSLGDTIDYTALAHGYTPA
ncbi:MAG: hypothetical protein KC910_01190 [Candidatus Eremiobacteraeota bacterium]|nr:hypothetical protein [Candidatus Eremiobacteraeota bacterium]